MRRRPHLALAAAALAGLVLGACGTSSGRLPAGRASAMQAELDQVAASVRSGDCTAAEQALSRVQGELLNLPRSTDAELRRRLQQGVDNLRARVPAACQEGGQSSTETQTQTKSDTQSTDEKKTEKTDTGTTEQTTPPSTDTGQTQTPTDTGQTQPPNTGTSTGQNGTGGASPGGQGGGG